jgi:FkbM family methyltransferase
MQLDDFLERTVSRTASGTQAAEAVLGSHRTKPRYAIGKNSETLAVHRLISLDGIIDDYAAQGDLWHGIPLLSTNSARKDAWVVNCSTSVRPVDTLGHLLASGFQDVVSVSDLVCAANGDLPWPSFVQAQRKEMREHVDAWQTIHDTLADEASRKTLLDVLQYRLTADSTYMRGYQVRIAEQYFEPFMRYRNEVFVDAGGFDGDTTEGFATRYPDYERILLFEPSGRNMSLARARLARFRDIEFFPIGLSDARGRLRFDPASGSASSVTDSGGEEIVVDTLDATVSEPVSFIKMDLEGWEMPALRGASGHIRDGMPKLAIAAYHDAPDLRCIQEFVQSFDHRYRMFLRHYTQGWSETVLFFVPSN